LGGGIYAEAGSVRLQSSVLAYSSNGFNCFGNVIDVGHNISSDSSCNFTANTSFNNTDPKLSALDDFGGPTRTIALLAGSPALDAADPVTGPPTGQRGVVRPFGSGCDIGAFESAPPYSVRGRLVASALSGVTVSAGGQSVPAASNGVYILNGLANGTYSVVPSAADKVFSPRSQTVNVITDVVGVDFLALRTNGLVALQITEQLFRIIFAGAPEENYELLSTRQLPGWELVTAFRTDANGLFELSVTNTPGINRLYGVRKP